MPRRSKLLGTYEAKLAASGLTPADARRLDFSLLSAVAVARLGAGFDARRAGFTLPYHDAAGAPTGFFRLRYLEPPSGFARFAARPQRYAQPAGSAPALYLPRLVAWAPLLADASVHLLVTEGELKAAAATKAGFPTLGLGGVDAWRSAKRGYELLPGLKAIAWRGRRTSLVFDSDVRQKPEVRRALLGLADALTQLGAVVEDVALEDVAEGAKTGLDDYLVARGAAALRERLEAAVPFARSRALHELSLEVAYVRDPGHVVELETGTRMTPHLFQTATYKNRDHHVLETRPDGASKLVRYETAKEWLRWPARNDVARLTYQPGQPRLTAARELNLWRGWGVEPRRGDVAPFLALFEHLLTGATDDERAWLLRWFAYPLQHPGTKLFTAVLVWGLAQGTGKSLLGYALGRIYGENFSEIQPSHLHDQFNEWAIQKQFVLGDEIAGGDRRADGDYVKRLITQATVRVNQKYLPVLTIPDCLNYYFTSNHPDPFYLEPGDRRFFVHEVTVPPREPAFYARVDRWLRGAGPAALFAHLLELDLGGFDPRAPAPVTAAKRELTRLVASDLDSWAAGLLADPRATLVDAVGCVEPSDLYTAAQLLALYDPDGRKRVTVNGMARALRRAGVPLVGDANHLTPTSQGFRRLYAVANLDRWTRARPAELREAYEKTFSARPPAPAKF